jgi:tetratricopeptide (TPR) repeat protein
MSYNALRIPQGFSARRICWALLILGFAFLFLIQRRIDRQLGIYSKISDVLYIPAGTNLRRLSLGYEGLLADIYWTRVVQYFGRNHMENAGSRYELLAPLLRITTDLDPQLLIAYRFGAIFLMGNPPEGAGQPEEALQLIRRGIVANPDYWRLWQDLGFVYYWNFKDYKTAARIFKVGSERPGAAFWMKALAGTVAAKGGDVQTARFLWSEVYRHADTDAVRRTAEVHLELLDALDQIERLNGLLALYRQKEGHQAKSFNDLYASGLLRGLPVDPTGAPYVIGLDGRAHLGQGSPLKILLAQ